MDFNYFLNSCSITKRVSARRQSLQDLGYSWWKGGGELWLSQDVVTLPPHGHKRKKQTHVPVCVYNPHTFRGHHHFSCLAAVAPAGERRRRELAGEFFFSFFVFEPTECASICLPLMCVSHVKHMRKTGAPACPPRLSSSFLIRGNAFYVKAVSYLRCPSAASKY